MAWTVLSNAEHTYPQGGARQPGLDEPGPGAFGRARLIANDFGGIKAASGNSCSVLSYGDPQRGGPGAATMRRQSLVGA
jgi:hypothetical protein